MTKLMLMLCCLAVSLGVSAERLVLDICEKASDWRFHNGAEFPGAEGRIVSDPATGKLILYYDFSRGGKYVSAAPAAGLPSGVDSVTVELNAETAVNVSCRMVDADGRNFQSAARSLTPGRRELSWAVNGPWSSAWGGGTQAKPVAPKGFSLIFGTGAASGGKVGILSCRVDCSGKQNAAVVGEPSAFSGCGWQFSANWLPGVRGPVLQLNAENVTGSDLDVSFDFPADARPLVTRYTLSADRRRQSLMYVPPFSDGGNPHNIYQIAATFRDKQGNSISRVFKLTGSQASPVLLGATPLSSREIAESSFGVCCHFSYGTSGAFAGWRDYRRLTSMIAAAGFKWIRDGVRADQDAAGNFQVRQYDLDWIKLARQYQLAVILVIDMKADEPLEQCLKRIAAIVEQTKGLVTVYELGNEPNNFGNWLKKYGGTWNGKEKDGSTSPWVKAHLQYTNAAADLIKKLRPDAVTIGLGACAPTNIRYLDLGVTANLDGVVEHPYGFSLPPEKVPWGVNLEKRDGIKIGDADNTFAGLVNSYFDHFKRTGIKRSLWITEFGFTTYWFNGKNEKTMYLGYSEEAQAAYLPRRFIEGLTLPVKVACVYDFIDDYGSEPNKDEANFGIIRADFSPKPSYYAIQRMNALFNGFSHDRTAVVKVVSQPLHRGSLRSDLVRDWDKVDIKAGNEVKAFGFASPAAPDSRLLAVWSTLPFSGESNNRVATVTVKGWNGFAHPVAVDLLTGRSFDVPCKVDGDLLTLENLTLGNHPLVIRFFRD